MFLRFLVVAGKCEPGVEYAVPTIAEWRLSRLPKYLQPEEVERAIDACDLSTATGARDRAVVLLMARLGLRAGDVAALKLCDVKWEEATLVVSGKNRREARLPLPKDVGDAIRFYLENYRPRVENKEVFISHKAPLGSITYSTISRTARRTLERAGIDAPSYGAHVFRHSAATGLLRQGASLQTIGTLLRHDSIETTAHYAKVDVDLLKQVTMPWPGVETC
jgi:site-specific recombinase XerD